jgi:hypothetical protein
MAAPPSSTTGPSFCTQAVATYESRRAGDRPRQTTATGSTPIETVRALLDILAGPSRLSPVHRPDAVRAVGVP